MARIQIASIHLTILFYHTKYTSPCFSGSLYSPDTLLAHLSKACCNSDPRVKEGRDKDRDIRL